MDTASRWSVGEVVVWRYRRRGWTPGVPETAHPVRVVRDDERGVVVWLAPGTVGLRPERADGRPLRADPSTMFTAPRQQGRTAWHGDGILRISPAGLPWSVWLFDGDDGFSCWYVNLEDVVRRERTDLVTTDLVLDLLVAPDGTITRKDEDELAEAVRQGRFTSEEAAEIEGHAESAAAWVAGRPWPLDEEWVRWRPPEAWTEPTPWPTP